MSIQQARRELRQPVTLMGIIIENNPDTVADRMYAGYQTPTDNTPEGIFTKAVEFIQAYPESAEEFLNDVLSVPVIAGNMTDVGFEALAQEIQAVRGVEVSPGVSLMGPLVDIPIGDDDGGTPPVDDPTDPGGSTFNWGELFAGIGEMLPGIINAFDNNNGGPGTVINPTPNTNTNQGLGTAATVALWSGGIIVFLLMIWLVIRAIKKG